MTDPIQSAIQLALHGLSDRRRVTDDNMANIQTPGFLAGETDFESSLEAALNGAPRVNTRPAHKKSLAPTREDGNNVDLDNETLTAIDTNLRYTAMVEAMNHKFRTLRSRDRKRHMTLFNDFKISGSGLYVYRKWMDAISDNIANLNTIKPFDEDAFQERFIEVQNANVKSSGGGVAIKSVKLGSAEGELRFDPDHPNANEDGYVRAPAMQLADQMTNLILAQRGYQANLAAIERARNAYESALTLGK